MSATSFQIGDKVNWVAVRGGDRSIGFSERRGKIKELHPSGATVKMGNGRSTFVLFEKLHKDGESHGVTNVFNALAGKKGGIESGVAK